MNKKQMTNIIKDILTEKLVKEEVPTISLGFLDALNEMDEEEADAFLGLDIDGDKVKEQ